MIRRRAHQLTIVLSTFAVCVIAATVWAGEPAEEIHRVEGDVKQPVKIKGPAPVYPPALKAQGIEGRVVAETVIAKDGRIESIEIVQTPDPEFGEAVRESLRQWRFEPATLDGEPVSVSYRLTINFALDSDDEHEHEDGDEHRLTAAALG